MHERKATRALSTSIADRTVTGVFSVFGVRDDYDDVVQPGAFRKTIAERGTRILHLWSHSLQEPPIATIDALRELRRDELPARVLEAYPAASGGVEVTRTYLDTPRGNEVLTALRAGAPLQMSFAFTPIVYDFGEQDGAPVRYLREVKLFETSDVLWGANDATVAVRSQPAVDLLTLIHLLRQYRVGRRNNVEDQARINDIARLAVELGAENVVLRDAAPDETDKTDETDAPDETDDTTRRAARIRARALRLRLHMLLEDV